MSSGTDRGFRVLEFRNGLHGRFAIFQIGGLVGGHPTQSGNGSRAPSLPKLVAGASLSVRTKKSRSLRRAMVLPLASRPRNPECSLPIRELSLGFAVSFARACMVSMRGITAVPPLRRPASRRSTMSGPHLPVHESQGPSLATWASWSSQTGIHPVEQSIQLHFTYQCECKTGTNDATGPAPFRFVTEATGVFWLSLSN